MVVPKSEKMQRRAETNKEQTQNHGYLKENHEGQIGLRSKPKPRGKLEDSAQIEGFLSVWGFNGEQWRFVVAVGDGERAWNIGNGFERKEEKKMTFFQGYTESKG